MPVAFLVTIYSGLLENAAIGNDDLLDGLVVGTRLRGLDSLDDVHPVKDAAENNMLAVKPGSVGHSKEELGAVGVRPSVRHGEAPDKVLDLKVLIRELGTIDGLATRAIVVREVAALDHELGDDAMERRALVAEAHLAGAELLEVLRCLRDDRAKKTHGDPADGLATNRDVEEDLVGNWRVHRGLFYFLVEIQFKIVCSNIQSLFTLRR